MKIQKNGMMYVERTDLYHLTKIPLCVFHELERYASSFDSFIPFCNQESIDFFKKSWILDYDQIKDLSVEEIDSKIMSIKKILAFSKKKIVISDLINKLESLVNYKNSRIYYDQIIKSYFKVKTLRR